MMIEQDTAKRMGRNNSNKRVTGVHRNTISAGLKELRSGEDDEIVSGHVRRRGGGRKTVAQSQQGIAEALDSLVDNSSYGNPENPLRWTTKSLRNLADELTKEGFSVSHNTVGKLLKELVVHPAGNYTIAG